MKVTIWHNIATDPQGRHIAQLDGYLPGHPLVPVFQYDVQDGSDPVEVADEAFEVFNIGDDPAFGPPDLRALHYRARQNRRLPVGDVVQVGDAWLACASTR